MNDRQFLRSVTEDRDDASLRQLKDLERAAIPFAVHDGRPDDGPRDRHRADEDFSGELRASVIGDRGRGPGFIDRVSDRRRTRDRERRYEDKPRDACAAGRLQDIGGAIAVGGHEFGLAARHAKFDIAETYAAIQHHNHTASTNFQNNATQQDPRPMYLARIP